MKVNITLDWDSIWEKFDDWYNDTDDNPSWENQKKHLESLVEEHILYQKLK